MILPPPRLPPRFLVARFFVERFLVERFLVERFLLALRFVFRFVFRFVVFFFVVAEPPPPRDRSSVFNRPIPLRSFACAARNSTSDIVLPFAILMLSFVVR